MIKKTGLKVFILWIACAFSTAQAIEFIGQAYGITRELAKKQALAALSESIIVDVKSVFESQTYSDGNIEANKKIHSVSELPLLGVDVSCLNKISEFFCNATLNSDRSLKFYLLEINRLQQSISSLNKNQKRENNKHHRYKILNEILTQIEEYNKFKMITRLLGAPGQFDLKLQIAEVQSKILTIEEMAPSLEIAAKILTRELDKYVYFIQPPLPQGSKQATMLSRLMRDKISVLIKSTEQFNQSSHRLKGSYEILSDGIIMTYRVVNNAGSTLATRIVKISPSAYKNISYRPKSIDFEQLLHEGYIVSSDFKASLNTNLGKEDLLFQAGQEIELFVKLNSAGYFYLVSHNTSNNVSYILQINEAKGKRAFVRYINADDANHWVSLDKFEVSKPYGSENLQLIASNKDLINKLPTIEFDAKTELYIVPAKSAKDAVIKTRGLKPKKTSSIKSAETSLSFTTMNK